MVQNILRCCGCL